MRTILGLFFAAAAASGAFAQGPPPPPPLQPLQPPLAPPGNQPTFAKTQLGRALFWDEQMSASRTMACGTCHFSTHGGSDPRSLVTNAASSHPGLDGLFGTPDDVTGSLGVQRALGNGDLVPSDFGLAPQVTSRKAPSTLMAAYTPRLFWDGRANGPLVDPLTGQTVLQGQAALEVQVLAPPVSDVEMGHIGDDWSDVVARIAGSEPLALSPSVPAVLSNWIAGRTYPQLFAEAFGTTAVTPGRIAMAIASYERSLAPTQTPLDTFLATGQGLTPLEQQGFQLFGQLNCVNCHAGNRFTDDQFHYTGVRPVDEDLGRFEVTGVQGDRGRFRTPSLRNVRDRGPFMHDGSLATLADVVEFYDRGGDFDAPNKAPGMVPLGLTQQQKNALVAFLGRPLTDQRAVDESGPFERPLLHTEGPKVNTLFGTASVGGSGSTPRMWALEPAFVGNTNTTIAIDRALGGAPAWLVFDLGAAPSGFDVLGATSFVALSPVAQVVPTALAGVGSGAGHTSMHFALTVPSLAGLVFHAQWFVLDPDTSGGLLAATPAARVEVLP
jgi:cytochrome c peroxidase